MKFDKTTEDVRQLLLEDEFRNTISSSAALMRWKDPKWNLGNIHTDRIQFHIDGWSCYWTISTAEGNKSRLNTASVYVVAVNNISADNYDEIIKEVRKLKVDRNFSSIRIIMHNKIDESLYNNISLMYSEFMFAPVLNSMTKNEVNDKSIQVLSTSSNPPPAKLSRSATPPK